AHRESSVCWAVSVRTAHPTAASPKLLLRFSLQSGAYKYESCACSRDPGEKYGLTRISHQAAQQTDMALAIWTKARMTQNTG
ncbi:MAG: hypothetical protein WBO93_03700, partial [Gammaproteobacteria bacterium]